MIKCLRCSSNVSNFFNRRREYSFRRFTWTRRLLLEEIRCCFKFHAINLSITIFVCQFESFLGFFGVFIDAYCFGQLFQSNSTTLVKVIVLKLVWKWKLILWLIHYATFAPAAAQSTIRSAWKAPHTTNPPTTGHYTAAVHCAQNQNSKNR